MINEACGGVDAPQPKNIGGKIQCIEAPVKTLALALDTFSFATVAASKLEANWRLAIKAKQIVIFPYIEGITANNTEATIKNGRYRDYLLKPAVSGSTYRMDLGLCTYEAVKSYENSDYKRIFRITAEDQFTADVQSLGSVKGEAISNFLVGMRNEATDDDVAYTDIGIKYRKEQHSILQAEFDLSELEGVYDANFVQVSASATQIKFKAFQGCGGAPITNFVDADIKLFQADGITPRAHTFVAADSNGIYTLTGTGFVTGDLVTTDGVVDKLELFYENVERLSIIVT